MSVGPKCSLLGRTFVCVHVIVREICATTSASISVAAPVSSRRKASRYMGTNARRRSLTESPTTSPGSSKNQEKALAVLGDSAPDFLSGFTPLSLPQTSATTESACTYTGTILCQDYKRETKPVWEIEPEAVIANDIVAIFYDRPIFLGRGKL